MMRFTLTVSSILLISIPSIAQNLNTYFADNNPKITDNESIWLNANFQAEQFDFKDKYIGFIDLSIGLYGIGTFIFDYHKHKLTELNIDKTIYQLIILDSSEKTATNGYDAILVLAKKGIRGKLRRLKRSRVISQTKKKYPQIPWDAGLDSNSTLNSSNATFFNELYKTDTYSNIYKDSLIDFTGKKVAIYNTNCGYGEDKIERITIPHYIARVRKRLYTWGFAHTDMTYILTKEQKEQTGGYDIIITYSCKREPSIHYILKQL